MNEQYEWEGPGLERFFAEAEMEDEVRRRRRVAPWRFRPARPMAFRKPYSFKKIRPAFFRPGLIRPWPPIKPVRPKLPIRFPLPGILDPSLWRDPNRPPEPRPPEPASPPPPPASSSPPPPASSPGTSSPPEPAPMEEPPDMTAGEPSPGATEPPDEPAGEPTGNGDAGTPNEEFFSLFAEYEYPSHEFGGGSGHTGGCCASPGRCTCGHEPESAELLSEFFPEFEQPEASVLGLEALDTEFEAARYSEPEWEYAEPSGSKGELNEFFTPYAHSGGNYPDRRRGIGFRQRHPRFGYGWGNQFGRQEFEDESSYEVEPTKTKTKTKPKPAPPVISPLATAAYGLRKGSRRSVPVFGVCVHTTSSGPARKAKKDPRRSALKRALDFYIKGSEGFPHYVIAYDGSIIATCDENQIAWHAGFGAKVRAHYKTWTAPKWWSSVWNPKGAKSPLDLFPKGAVSANSAHIGVEMLADTTGYGFTDAQYTALAKLVVDIARRYKLQITSAPSARLLGHEDVHPLNRQNKGGGWDPGAHRDKPKFSWSRVWALIQANP